MNVHLAHSSKHQTNTNRISETLLNASSECRQKDQPFFSVLVHLVSSTYTSESPLRIRSNLECLFMTYILGFAVNVTERATWPFCDMRRCNSSKVFERESFQQEPSLLWKDAQGEVLWDHLTQAGFWFSETMQFASGRDTNPTRVCTAHIDWTFCCKFHLLMEYSCITFIWGLFNELAERDLPSPKQRGFPPLPYLKHVGAIAESVGIHETANDFSKWKLDKLDWHQIQESPASLVGNCKMYSNISGKGWNSFCHSESPKS